MPRRKERKPYWKEPAVVVAVVASMILLVAAAAAMLYFSKYAERGARRVAVAPAEELPPTVEIDGREVNLDALGVQDYAELLAEVSDQPKTLESIECALVKSLQQGREKVAIPSLAPLENPVPEYPSHLRHRLEELALLGAVKGNLWAGACMELGLFEYYRQNRTGTGDTGNDVTTYPFGDAYAALGLTSDPQGRYSSAVFFLTKAIKSIDPSDQWRGETNFRRAAAAANIALILRVFGDRAGTLELLSEAQLIFQFLHSATNVDKIREYIEVVRSEGPPPDSPMSAVAVEIKEKLR